MPYCGHKADGLVYVARVSGLYIDSYIHDPHSMLQDQPDLLPFVARVFGCQDTTYVVPMVTGGRRVNSGWGYFLSWYFRKSLKLVQ